MAITRQNAQAFLGRDWALMRRVKDQSVARFIAQRGTGAALRLGQMLLAQGWPLLSPEDRARDDTPGLVALGRKLRRA